VIDLALPIRLAGYALGFCCWLFALLHFNVKSWEPHTTVTGAIAGWFLVLTGTVLFFLCTLGISPRLIPTWLSYLGRISYGLYIVHSFVFFLVFEKALPSVSRHFPGAHLSNTLGNILATIVVLALSIILAHISFTYFERPFLRLKERFTFVAAREETFARD
jgi:peptidoglycan/LPS O-acetylase OafA/YrhL